MDRQTQVTPNDSADSTSRPVVQNAADVWHQILLLGELQTRLLYVEFEEGFREARTGVLCVVGGALFGLASLPVLLAALALVLIETTTATPALAFGIVSVVAVAVAAGLIAGGWMHLSLQTLKVPRSRAAWSLNWRWLKETLHRERRPHNGMAGARGQQLR